MDLKDFVKESLVQISNGISEANEELADCGALINPLHITTHTDGSQSYGRTGQPRNIHTDSRVVEKVEFDVAVLAEKGEAANARLKLSVASIGFGGGAGTETTDRSESRIKFTIPVVFPGVESNT
ncbi:trypco2 family protein [Saccharospirillum alexandrii]|uniref:trypco2 family protein n=1 Tax=Saccharospirillum alexandrii TaxID=2448477 RepID=UPI000FD7C489|nr:trypco2 family protein [Saccharospirillum alexandrii]